MVACRYSDEAYKFRFHSAEAIRLKTEGGFAGDAERTAETFRPSGQQVTGDLCADSLSGGKLYECVYLYVCVCQVVCKNNRVDEFSETTTGKRYGSRKLGYPVCFTRSCEWCGNDPLRWQHRHRTSLRVCFSSCCFFPPVILVLHHHGLLPFFSLPCGQKETSSEL